MVKSEPKKKLPLGGFFQKFFRKPEKSEKEQRLSVQRSIPYLEMGRDGICRVEEHLYSKTVRFYDINYQLAQNEDKNTIFESWCDFLNYFDASIRFQLSFINHKSDMSEYNKVIQIEPQHDQFDDVRMEYAQMLKQQLAKGNNGLVRTKYITFSIEAKSVREAKPRLERIETDILNNFKVLGVKAYPLNGVERLQIMYETFHQEEQQKFDFSYDRILQSGMTTKDFIAPTSFLFKSGKDFMMSDTYGAASYLNILAPELTDKVLAEFLDMDKNLVVSIHVQSVDQLKAIKLIKGKITDLDRMKIEEQKKAVRSGYDMEIIPSDLATYGGEAKKILDDLQSRNERMFLVTVLFLNTAKTKQELDSAVFQTAGIAQKFNCTLNRLDYLQEQGLMSSLPLANNLVPIKRALTTTSTAIFVPFTTQELFMEGDSLYYGLNAVSNNMIMADRKQLKNPNGLILGTPGSGKSFSAKREITNVFFTTTDDIIVADPEGEYYPLVEALGGQVIHISSTSKDYINPMDINLNYADDDNPLGMKSDFILSLCELIMGARDGMEPEEKSVIDRCLPLVYQKYLNDPKPENMPTLGDLYDCLREQKERQAQRIATALEIYVNGSLRVFNHQTNVELDNRIICFDIKELGKQLKKLGMLIVQDQVWNRVTINRNSKKNTRYYIDEFHLLLKEEQTAAYSVEIWKRFRKWGGVPTGITQNIKDLLASREIENIFENSDFIYMLNQASGDRQILAKQLNISPFQLSYVTNSNEGEDAPRHHSTAKQSADYYKAHQEDGKPKDAPAEADVEPQTKKGRLSFEDEKGGIVRGVGMGVKKVAKKGVDTATGFAHQKVHQVEKDNSGVEAAHKSEEAAERLHHFVKGRKKPKDKSARAEKRGGEDQKSSRLKFSESEGGTAENAAEPSLKKKQPQPPPTAAGGEAKTVGAKFYQKKQYKDAYAAAKRGQKAGTAASKQAAAATNTITEKAKAAVQEIVVQNKTLWVSIGVGILLVMVMLGAFSSCGAAIQGTGSTFVGTTYPSKDADMKGAEEDYLELEKELDKQIRQMESTHPGYDEYRYQLDEIGHDPYQLISHLTAVYEQFTRGQVKPVIKELFKQQYLLKVWETIEIRTRMETRVGIRPTIDAFGNVSMETYTYQEEVEYEYKILNVLLKNKGFDTIARKNMNQKQTGRYDAYNLTYGNRPELFGAGSPTYSGGTTGSIGTGGGAGGSGGGFKYDIPSEALSDEKFARMIEEAEKYLGMPYVWGGSSPSTSFDCSGFVCWVINNSGNGWSVGRTTANGLRGKCSYVSRAEAQPGDLIFFEKTYNTAGASHVGIYVGDGMMIHCGDPISYTSINSTYWQSHFLGFGRIN